MQRGIGWSLFFGSLLTAASIGLSGCGGSTAPEKKPAATDGKTGTGDKTGGKTSMASSAEEETLTITEDSPPDIVVSGFLEALRSGDKEATAALLTDKAREETTKHDLSVDPTSSPNSLYEVAAPKFLTNNPKGSHVDSIWHEKFEDGSDASYTITWVLRKEATGWRIAGMAMEIIPGKEPCFLNFEDPIDMMKKRDEALAYHEQMAAAEMAAAQAKTTTAGTPSKQGNAPGKGPGTKAGTNAPASFESPEATDGGLEAEAEATTPPRQLGANQLETAPESALGPPPAQNPGTNKLRKR